MHRKLAYRYWHGPIIREILTQVWEGHAARLFISFGPLQPADYTLPNGRPGAPRGRFELTNMESFSDWALSQHGRMVIHSDSPRRTREKALQILVGKRLLSLRIDQICRSTLLTFSRGLVLATTTMRECLDREPHWLLRLPDTDERWPHVILKGTIWHDRDRF